VIKRYTAYFNTLSQAKGTVARDQRGYKETKFKMEESFKKRRDQLQDFIDDHEQVAMELMTRKHGITPTEPTDQCQ